MIYEKSTAYDHTENDNQGRRPKQTKQSGIIAFWCIIALSGALAIAFLWYMSNAFYTAIA